MLRGTAGDLSRRHLDRRNTEARGTASTAESAGCVIAASLEEAIAVIDDRLRAPVKLPIESSANADALRQARRRIPRRLCTWRHTRRFEMDADRTRRTARSLTQMRAASDTADVQELAVPIGRLRLTPGLHQQTLAERFIQTSSTGDPDMLRTKSERVDRRVSTRHPIETFGRQRGATQHEGVDIPDARRKSVRHR